MSEKPGRVVLITGGSRGIGAATARAMAADGWDIALSYRTDSKAAEIVVADCAALGRRAMAIRADVSAADDIDRLFERCDALGPLSAVINNAGIVTPAARVEDYTADRLNQLLATNVTGAFLVAGRAVRAMSTRHGGNGGVIVNVSSRAAVLGSAGEYVDTIAFLASDRASYITGTTVDVGGGR